MTNPNDAELFEQIGSLRDRIPPKSDSANKPIDPEQFIQMGIFDMHNCSPARLHVGQTFDIIRSASHYGNKCKGDMTVEECVNVTYWNIGQRKAFDALASSMISDYTPYRERKLDNKILTIVGYDGMADQFIAMFNYDDNHGGICKLSWT